MFAGFGNSLTPAAIERGLARLERMLDKSEADGADLADLVTLGPLAQRGFLMRVLLLTLLRRGPGRQAGTVLGTGTRAEAEAAFLQEPASNSPYTAPARLLALASDGAERGLVSLADLADLRGILAATETLIAGSGAWDSRQPLWWHPLVPLDPLVPSAEANALQTIWRNLEQGAGSRFERIMAAQSERAPGKATGFAMRHIFIPGLLDEALLESIWPELETAHEQGTLNLARAGVGGDGRVSVQRSDEVVYLTGTEPDLIQGAPHLAALVQWCLTALAKRIVGRHAQKTPAITPPQTAMLARYGAPSSGYARHLDNPCGDQDNGRTLSLVLYLNPAKAACQGGELALWDAVRQAHGSAPERVIAPRGGAAVCFDSRQIAHQVRALDAGPPRWALTLWFSDRAEAPVALLPPLPKPDLAAVLLPIDALEPAPGRIVFHELDIEPPLGRLAVYAASARRPRIGLVGTCYRAGALLDRWCSHHFRLGVDHILLIFDHIEEQAEAALAARLRKAHPAHRLTIWSSARLMAERWASLPAFPDRERVEGFARGGSSSFSVAARQAMNASCALLAARAGELAGAPLDWLIHLDADELLVLRGRGRGGETLGQHFATADAAGIEMIRYANHELLHTKPADSRARFKLNPRLAAAKLGSKGWQHLVAHLDMAQTATRPYFSGYSNGKAAVSTRAGLAAAGVHGWYLINSDPMKTRFLAGPVVLHLRFASAAAFAAKYRDIAASRTAARRENFEPGLLEPGLFEPAPTEARVLAELDELHASGADIRRINARLAEIHESVTIFSAKDVELLEAAGLIDHGEPHPESGGSNHEDGLEFAVDGQIG